MLVSNQVAGKLGFNRRKCQDARGGHQSSPYGRSARCNPRCPLAPCGQRRALQMWPPPLYTRCAGRRILPCSSNVTEV